MFVKPAREFDRDQLQFVTECVLAGALDMVVEGLPPGMSWEQRVLVVAQPHRLSWYESGCLDTAGMALSILFAQLCDDGMGAGDALLLAGDFRGAVEDLFRGAWVDEGEAVLARIRERAGEVYLFKDLFENYPDVRVHAEKFVDFVMGVLQQG